MKKRRGIGCFWENFVEKSHHIGKKEDKKAGNMTDQVKAQNCIQDKNGQ